MVVLVLARRGTYTVLRSVMVRTTEPAPASSTSFSCQLRSTLIAWPPPSPPPREWIWEKPVDWGDIEERVVGLEGAGVCDMPLYLPRRASVNET